MLFLVTVELNFMLSSAESTENFFTWHSPFGFRAEY